MTYDGGNFMYIIDDEHKVAHFNETMGGLYPHLKVGDTCYVSLMGLDAPCSECPLQNRKGSSVTVYNGVLNRWVNVITAWTQLPGYGTCGIITCGPYASLHKNIMSRLPYLVGYDVFIEMNITQNRYRVMFGNEPETEISYAEEPLDKLLERTASTLIHKEDVDRFRHFWNLETLMDRVREGSPALQDTYREKNPYGGWDFVKISVVPESYIGTQDEIVIALYNIIKTQQTEIMADGKNPSAIEGDATNAILTGGKFRTAAKKYAEELTELPFVLAIDIEHFHLYNRWYGRGAGDRLLLAVAKYLVEYSKRYYCIPGYAGGDNFYLFGVYRRGAVETLQRELSALVGSFEEHDGFDVLFGAYQYRDRHLAPDDAMDFASMAMRRSSGSSRKNIPWYDEEMTLAIEREMRMIPEIEKGLHDKEFIFYLQPKFSVNRRCVVGAEALIRWNSKRRGMVAPGRFIPIAEKQGLIDRLDLYIWEAVVRRIRERLDQGIRLPRISLNVSRLDFYAMDVPNEMKDIVRRYGIDPSMIELEITESVFMSNAKAIIASIKRLREIGFRIAIDDFGSGYSSLNTLKDIPADTLKLDIGFLDLRDDNAEKGVQIIRSIMDMARSMNMEVIAEGVETEEQLHVLRELGCDVIQGYYYYEPMPPEMFEETAGLI